MDSKSRQFFVTPSAFEATNYRGIEYRRDLEGSLYMKSCGDEQCLPGHIYNEGSREGYHLHVVLSGMGRMRVRGCLYEIHEGQMFLVKSGEDILYQADQKDPWHYVWITYGGEYAVKYMECAGFTDGVYVQDCNISVNEFIAVVRGILERPHLNISSEVYRMSLAMRFLSLVIESKEKSEDLNRRHGDLSADDYVSFAADYIRMNYAHIRISDVARYIGINRTYLTSIFKTRMNMSPQEFLMQERMNRARELLTQTELPIYIIAQEIGYEDQLGFSKIFRKKYGVSPEQFRKKNKAESKDAPLTNPENGVSFI